MKKHILIISISVFFSSCASIFLPRKQTITINTGNEKAIVYVNNEEFGTGTTVTDQIKKSDDPLQVIIKTPGYKDAYGVLFSTHRPAGYWPLFILNVSNGCLGMMLDVNAPHAGAYDNINDFLVKDKLVIKQNEDKYIHFSNVTFDASKYDVYNVDPWHSKKNLSKNIEDAEKKAKSIGQYRDEMSDLKAGTKTIEEKKVPYSDFFYSENMYKTLKETGYVDTVNKVFTDNNNTLNLSGSIKKLYFYSFETRTTTNVYKRVKLNLTWYIKNTYNEILDSIETNVFSNDFYYYSSTYDTKTDLTKFKLLNRPFADAVDMAYLNLQSNPKFKTYLKMNTNFEITDPVLNLTSPKSIISEKSESTLSSVIVKTKDGHGSGFAITNDGYIITNYHVVAGKFDGVPHAVTIINSEGESVEGKIVRVNKFRDLALIKVDKTFEKVFALPNEKSYKTMQDVYTIGAPKSVELGQSISSGVISTERKANNNYLLQLGMSVNGGNSGGPLYDASGKLHGVIVSKLVGLNTEGVSFAVPAHMIKDYLKLKFE